MRNRKLFGLLGTLTLAAAGVAAFCGSLSHKNVVGTNAGVDDVNTTRIYCKMTQGWWKVDGAAVGCHSWGNPGPGTTWPGVRMAPVENETDIWYIDLDTSKVQNVIFTRVNGSGAIADWGAKTKNLTIPTNGDNLFTITSSSEVWGEPGCEGTWSKYDSNPSGFYVVGKYGNCNWGIENASLMTVAAEDGYDYSVNANVELSLGDVFCVVYYKQNEGFDWSQSYRYSVVQDEGFRYCFSDAGDNDRNIKCWAGGTYTIRCHNFKSQSKTIYISSSDGKVNAEQFAAKLMSYGAHNPESGDTGLCRNGSFTECQNMFNGLSEQEKSKFIDFSNSSVDQFAHAYDRYVSWAAANNVDPFTGNPLSSNVLFTAFKNVSDSTWIIAVISLAGLTAIGGYFFYRKRKEN